MPYLRLLPCFFVATCSVMFVACSSEDANTPGANAGDEVDGGTNSGDGSSTSEDGSSDDGGGADGSSSIDPTANHRSGTRLRARVFAAGERHAYRWMEDTTYGVACNMIKADDGQRRCLPVGIQSNNPSGLYADASCTQEIVTQTTPTCAPAQAPRFVRRPMGTSACNGCTGVASIGPQLAPTAPVYNKVGATCSPTTAPAGKDLYPITAALPASGFVAIEYPSAEGNGRVHGMGARGSDGSYVAAYVTDRDLSGPTGSCTVHPDRSRVDRCMSTSTSTAVEYDANDCASPVIAYAGTNGAPGVLATAYTRAGGACGEALYEEYPLVATYTGPVYGLDGTTCAAVDPGTLPRWRIGAAVDPPRSPEAARTMVGEGPLQRMALTTSEGQVSLGLGCPTCLVGSGDDTFYDASTKLPCRVRHAADGRWACLPLSAGLIVYMDDKCTQTAVLQYSCPTGDFAWRSSTDACDDTVHVHTLGAAQTLASGYYQRDGNGGACTFHYGFNTVVRPLLDEVPPQNFVHFDEMLE